MNERIIEPDKFQNLGRIVADVVAGFGKERRWDGGKITEPGVYAGVDLDIYHRHPPLFDGFSISSSGLRLLLDRPAAYWCQSPYNPEAELPKERVALEFGKAAHHLLLSEEGFAERYVLQPDTYHDAKTGEEKPWNGNATVCRKWKHNRQAEGKVILSADELKVLRRMAEALSRKEAIRLGLLNGRVERSIFHRDGDIWLKARPDVIPSDGGDFVDLKTAANVDNDSVSRAIFANGYHVQAGFLRLIVREVLGAEAFSSFTFVFVEKAPPYDVRVMQLKDADIDLGERQAVQGLKLLRECLKRQEWPGYDGFDQHISYTEMPAWARTRLETQLAAEAA